MALLALNSSWVVGYFPYFPLLRLSSYALPLPRPTPTPLPSLPTTMRLPMRPRIVHVFHQQQQVFRPLDVVVTDRAHRIADSLHGVLV